MEEERGLKEGSYGGISVGYVDSLRLEYTDIRFRMMEIERKVRELGSDTWSCPESYSMELSSALYLHNFSLLLDRLGAYGR